MIEDYHCHTIRCGHATGTIQEYIDMAKKMKLTSIGFSDHYPLCNTIHVPSFKQFAMSNEDISDYVQELLEIRENNDNGIQIKIGLELDFVLSQVSNTCTLIGLQ